MFNTLIYRFLLIYCGDYFLLSHRVCVVDVYIGWRWRHFNDFIYVYRC